MSMINDIVLGIATKLKELYANSRRYVDNVPADFKKPSFTIFTIDQDYAKRIGDKGKSRISFDIAYFSNKAVDKIKSDCLEVQETLLRELDEIGQYWRATNKKARITDDVLHLTFDVNYSELKKSTNETKMQTHETNILSEEE